MMPGCLLCLGKAYGGLERAPSVCLHLQRGHLPRVSCTAVGVVDVVNNVHSKAEPFRAELGPCEPKGGRSARACRGMCALPPVPSFSHTTWGPQRSFLSPQLRTLLL